MILHAVGMLAVDLFESRSRLEAENVALRHQLIVLRRKVQGRVRLTNSDRWFFIQLYRWFPSILQVITVIGPSPALAHLPRQSALDGAGAADLLLQKHDAVEQRLRGRRAAGNVDVNRHDAVATPHDGIRVVVVAAAIGAGAHGDHVARLRHLVIDLA